MNKIAPLITAGMAILVGLASFQPGVGRGDGRFADVVVDPAKETITLHWKDKVGHVVGNIAALKTVLTEQGRTLVMAMNGGMYTVDRSPVGLYIEDGKVLRTLNTSRGGSDNFHLMPNGVFGLLEDGSAFVCTTEMYPEQKHVRYATQSGPMLVVDGMINANFKQGSQNLNIRNGVGIRKDGQLVFAISKEPVNFHDFASYFKTNGCVNALYLDGAISRAYIPTAGLEQLDGDLGVLIAVSAPSP